LEDLDIKGRKQITWNKVPEKLIASRIIKKGSAFHGIQRAVTVLEELATRPCPEPDE
jgi:hypothetical protein